MLANIENKQDHMNVVFSSFQMNDCVHRPNIWNLIVSLKVWFQEWKD